MKNKKPTTKLIESANRVSQSMIQLGLSIKPSADKVIQAYKKFENIYEKKELTK